MTALEFLQFQIEASGNQLSKVVHGIDPANKDFRLHDGGFSFFEQVSHLGEAYTAVLSEAAGTKYQWGSYKPSATEWPELLEEVLKLREHAVAAVLIEDDEKLKMGADYIVSHDLYHVGQLATMRLNVHPDWNMYELYS